MVLETVVVVFFHVKKKNVFFFLGKIPRPKEGEDFGWSSLTESQIGVFPSNSDQGFPEELESSTQEVQR